MKWMGVDNELTDDISDELLKMCNGYFDYEYPHWNVKILRVDSLEIREKSFSLELWGRRDFIGDDGFLHHGDEDKEIIIIHRDGELKPRKSGTGWDFELKMLQRLEQIAKTRGLQ